MRRRRPEDERSPQTTARAAPAAPASGILALQQSAGNHAVAGMLARKADVPESEPPTVDISDLGVLILESWTHVIDRTALGGAGAGARGRPGDDEGHLALAVTSRAGPHTPRIQQWLAAGKTIESAAFENKGFKITLEKAHITAYTASEHEGVLTENWSIEGRRK